MKIPLLCVLCLFAGLSWAQTQQVAMRDGVRLATDIYGAEPGVRRSALLLRTPYNKGGAKDTAERFAAAGYLAVVQDTRGAYAAESKYVHYNNDDQDGFDAIEWIVRQPWSDGKVGMWGSSHPGAVQWVLLRRGFSGVAVKGPRAVARCPTLGSGE
jgi:uncharacterized protein